MNARARWTIAFVALLSLANVCTEATDPIIEGDPIDPGTGLIYEIVPGTPRIDAGPDGEFETDDDVVGPEIGDVDIVIRSVETIGARYPDPAPLRGAIPTVTASLRGLGAGISFSVGGTDGVLPLDRLARFPFPGHPILVMAFADLDGDGYIGITHLDGDPTDASTEEAEFVPVARRYAIAGPRIARGELFIPIGGPPGAELDIALAAATYSGPRQTSFLGGGVPMGPAVMTKLPFLPETNVSRLIGDRPTFATPGALVGPEIEPVLDPDPADPAIGETFTIRLDGSEPSIDTARVLSGDFVRFALAQRPDPETFNDMPSRPVRPGLGESGERVLLELLHHLTIPDDGGRSSKTLRVVPIDAHGNIAALPAPTEVEIVASGSIRIESPDADGDPMRETVTVVDARGATLVVNDPGARWDDPNQASLELHSTAPPNRLLIEVVDPDVDDSGLVDLDDLLLIEGADRAEVGEEGYDASLDLNGDGRVRREDVRLASDSFGSSVPVP